MKIVLQKYIADSGFCSRRKAEEYIRSGKVLVNKKKAELGMRVDDGDEILLDGQKIGKKKDYIYIVLNKPVAYTCTNRKFRGEKNVFDLVNIDERLFVVGRLDKDSEGLVLLTNDGDLAQRITHPSFEHQKKYIVKVKSSKDRVESVLEKFLKGIDIGDGDGILRAKKIKYLGNDRFEVFLTEGKKRQIRRMFKALGLEVESLLRTEIGDIKLENLKKGEWKKIKL